MKDIIKLIYVKDGHEYSTDIDRTVLFEQMDDYTESPDFSPSKKILHPIIQSDGFQQSL